jgi:2-hydroxycyclohexanecarboxyl-CoA dehydrogenase
MKRINSRPATDRLLGEVAVVTGGASGIGRGIVDEFVRQGAAIAIFDVNASAAEATCDELIEAGRAALAVPVDVTDQDAVRRAVSAVQGRLGDVTVLVNCAGFNSFSPVENVTDELWATIRSINLDGSWNCARAVVPTMVANRRGRILNISSAAGVRAIPHAVPYSAAKHGILGLTRGLALDLAPHQITVNCICPATVETPLVRSAVSSNFLERMRDTIPLGRFGTVEDIAQAALFLCSREAAFVTGVILPVDGGLTCGVRAHHFE